MHQDVKSHNVMIDHELLSSTNIEYKVWNYLLPDGQPLPQIPPLPDLPTLPLTYKYVSSLSMGNYIQVGGSHKSDFHNITQNGSKMCHRSVMGVMCDTTWHSS